MHVFCLTGTRTMWLACSPECRRAERRLGIPVPQSDERALKAAEPIVGRKYSSQRCQAGSFLRS